MPGGHGTDTEVGRLRTVLVHRPGAELSRIIHHQDDQVLFVHLGPAEGRGDRVITALGKPYLTIDAPCYIV